MAFYIGGPMGYQAVVWRHEHVEPIIKVLCSDGKFDEQDFTATDVGAVTLHYGEVKEKLPP